MVFISSKLFKSPFLSKDNVFPMVCIMHQMLQMFYLAFIFLQMFLNLIVADSFSSAFDAIFAVLILVELDPMITFIFQLIIKNFHPWVSTAPHYMAF